ncbi:hypothetical protein CBS101457_004265 [Exobasidium rhododendri]|nr:hypothetical protein CBS101457_004265 [Exobasidium rhododendri]
MTIYPLDATGTHYFNMESNTPLPIYPFQNSIFASLVSTSLYDVSLKPSVPFLFSIAYYLLAHSANHVENPKDRTKGQSIGARSLRFFIILHNAVLCLYSFFTFAAMAPIVLDMFWQGYRGAGHAGLQLALCSMPTNNSLLGRWTYLFYLSKYYEVVDSIILFLKGKQIGNLQSYHHAGALICMWIAYRYQSQPVWVFCVFNSGVHTLMYAYYFCSALRLPFPKTLKRNLTTLQIIQIASGTIITNLYFFQRIDPVKVHALLVQSNVHSLLPPSIFASADECTYAKARSMYGTSGQHSCLERRGAAVALHVNTMYMTPLLALFANFFAKAYLKKSLATPKDVKREN